VKRARYLLDTGVWTHHLSGRRETVKVVWTLGQAERLAVATVARLELHAGLLPEERFECQELLSRLITYDLDGGIADRAGDYVRECRAEGITLSVPDAIIAATAIGHRLTLVTFNPKHFPIRGLSIFPLETMEGG
jgi:predicted nucleic acid-binding protein